MATLELEINCLCLFVPDPTAKAVHVLMPGTNGHLGDHDGHAEHAKHVVRMLHRSFDGDEKLLGRPLEGWALTLSPTTADADANRSLVQPGNSPEPGELPDLSAITRKTVDPALLGPRPGAQVAARITLRSGGVKRLAHESTWRIENNAFGIREENVRIAHRVVWEISDVDPKLGWKRLNGGANGDYPPLETLDELEPEDDLSYKLRIFHVTENALPPRGGTLSPAEMRQHYRGLYALLGENNPADELLPRIQEKQMVDVNCGGARAQPTPTK